MTTSAIPAPLAPSLGTHGAATREREYATAGAKTTPRAARRYDWAGLVPFILCHLAAFGAIWSGVTWQAVAVGIALYWARIFGVTAGYHRYFAHRTFETSRPMQFALAFLAQSTAQKGALWWASHHRAHHLYSDTERDLHSPRQHGFLQSHLGWIFSTSDDADWGRIKDFAKYPELVWLNKYHLVPPIVLGVAVWLAFGWSGLFIGFFLSTVFTWHGTFCINSLAHVWGKRRFATKDDSRNSFVLALITMGEGWHNNHHHYMQSARQGFYWWEIDVTFYLLKGMEKLGLVWNLKEPPPRVLEAGRRADAAMAAPARDQAR